VWLLFTNHHNQAKKSMLSKNEIKYIQSLSQKKIRTVRQVFVVEGSKMVEEILFSKMPVQKVFATADWLSKTSILQQRSQAVFQVVSEPELEKISQLQTPNEVLAIVPMQVPANEPNPQQLILALDNIQDPGNLGTIVRTADWFGVHQIVANLQTADIYNAKTIQSTMGSFARVQVWYKDLKTWLPSQTMVLGAAMQGENIFQQSAITNGVVLIGNEGKGISPALQKMITHAVHIPAKGAAESLNAAVATGIILAQLTKTM
jgi:RNA methyltransferase, TrmH family